MFDNLFQTGQPSAGGWRYPYSRPTSIEALYQPQTIDPEFLKKVSRLGAEEPKGLLSQAVEAKPLTGLIESGGDLHREDTTRDPQQSGENFSMTPGGNLAKDVSGWGFAPSMTGAGKGFATGGIMGALAGGLLGGQTLAPVQDVVAPGLNGYNMGDYGASPTEVGAPNAAQAQALADQLAKELAAYQAGGLLGSVGQDGGYGGFGGQTGGDGAMGFGGEY